MADIRINDNVSMSWLALGGTARGTQEGDKTQFSVMDRYFERGGRTFDSARVYGKSLSDESLGKWVKSRGVRSEVVICTKGSHPEVSSMHISRLSEKDIVSDLEDSLRAIGTDYSDVHLLHRDDVKLPVDGIMYALDKQVKAGKVRAIGASNWTAGRINEANQFAQRNGLTPFTVSQIHYSLAQTTPMQMDDNTLVIMNDVEYGWYKYSGMPVMAYGTMSRGYMAAVIGGFEKKPRTMHTYGYLPENQLRAKRLKALSDETGRSAASIMAAYVRDAGLRGIALCTFSSIAQLDETMDAEGFTLSPEQARYLETGTY